MFAISTSSLPPSPAKNQYLGVSATGQPAWITAGTATAAAAHCNGSSPIATKAGGGGLFLSGAVAPTFTIAVLQKTTQNGKVLISYGDNSGDGTYGGIAMATESPCYGVRGFAERAAFRLPAGVGSDGTPNGAIDDGKWHLIVVALYPSGGFPTSSYTCWIDGVKTVVSPASLIWTPVSNAIGMAIGGSVQALTNDPGPLTGDFSRWAYFLSRLTDANVTALYNAWQSSQAAYDAAVAALTPSIYYHFDETGGTNVTDYAGVNDATYGAGGTPAGATTSPFASAVVQPLPNLMTGLGDMVVGGTGGAPARLGRGIPGYFFHVNASTGALEWATAPSASGGTPAIVLGTAAAAGVASTFLRDDDTIVAFDTTAPVTQAFSDVAAVGVAVVAARRDHKHGMPVNPAGFPLTNASDETFQPNGVANNVLTLTNVASAVTGVQITGSATATGPTLIKAAGGTNVGLSLDSKGNAAVTVGATSGLGVVMGNTTSAIQLKAIASGSTAMKVTTSFGDVFQWFTANSWGNGLKFSSSLDGAAPSIQAIPLDTDTNVDLSLLTTGTGRINFGYASTAISGATPATLATGTGGGTGPATAAQNSWLAVKVNGTVNYIPLWQ